MTLQEYINQLNKRYISGISSEHAYRGDIETLLRSLLPDVEITNEPRNVTDCGNPDLVIVKNKIPIGYIEAKDVGKNLSDKSYKEQFDRYRNSLENLIITDYILFQFFQKGVKIGEIRIAEIRNGKLVALSDAFSVFTTQLQDFCDYVCQTIKSPIMLAEHMAKKARLLQGIIENAVLFDEQKNDTTELRGKYQVFKRNLIHDVCPREFADIFAQTLAYGMFAARLHDPDLKTFTRQEAAELIPNSNPFLRRLFQDIAGYDIDPRLRPTVDNLADVFRATDVKALLADFGKNGNHHDPIIHFYETFLSQYDPKLRKSRGVWYTPQPVVNFMVRAVDDILKTEFNLPDGLADTSKIRIKVQAQGLPKKIHKEVHRVQILDPATGTGTFLAEIIRHIHQTKFKAMQGAWSGYVENDLIPRLNGFELLMASYAMAHLKLDLLLTETGYKPKKQQRFRVFLTNSLEEHHPDTGSLFAAWLSAEANEANYIKRDTPVMVVIGNPPYSGHSANKGQWAEHLLKDYKQEPGGGKLQEKNPKWLNDDYVKFIRYGQYQVEKNGGGVLAFINPHGFLDNPTFRGMRWHLLKTFDKIYTIDLHGNAKKKETAPDGGKDKNVFDIKQGVSINLFIKTGKKKANELGSVFHYDLFGKREFKYGFLYENSVKTVDFKKLETAAPNYFFVCKDFNAQKKYLEGIGINELFPVNSVGIVTARDHFTIHETKQQLIDTIKEFLLLDNEAARDKFDLGKDVRDWTIDYAKNDLRRTGVDFGNIVKISYRLFDERYTYYTGKSKGFHCMPRCEVMQNFVKGNIGLCLCKQFKTGDNYMHVFISNKIIESSYVSNRTSEITSSFPLYLYPNTTAQLSLETKPIRTPNLNMTLVQEIAKKINLTFTPEPEPTENTFSPIDILDYIYAVLHSPSYRSKYKEFLKIDFPRVPYPENSELFWKLVALGGELRRLHLLESITADNLITSYPEDGDNAVTRKITAKDWDLYDSSRGLGRVWINDSQYVDQVPRVAWEFYIGGYQPAQKWLKDRHGRMLSIDDLVHYQKIIVALTETDRIMKAINVEIAIVEKG